MTRERVIDAAETIFLQNGFAAASVQAIASEAGYTTGAIYSTFGGKGDLYLAVAWRRADKQHQIWRDAMASAATSADAPRAMGVALRTALAEPEWYAAQFEFLAYASRDSRLREGARELARGSDPLFREILAKFSKSTPLPVDRLAPVILALLRGLALAWTLDPEATDDTLFSDAVAVLLGAGFVQDRRDSFANAAKTNASSRQQDISSL